MSTKPRPSYSEIVLAYLKEGWVAWHERRPASAVAVEEQLGLSFDEGQDALEELARRELIRVDDRTSGMGAYRLTLAARDVIERMPDLENVIHAHCRIIDGATDAPLPERAAAKVSIKDELVKIAISKTIDVAIQCGPTALQIVGRTFPWVARLTGMQPPTTGGL